MEEYIESSAEWEHTPGELPLNVHFHMYRGPKIPMGKNLAGGMVYRDMSQLVVTDVILEHESVLHDLNEFIPSWKDFDSFIDDLEYTLSEDCE